MILVSAVAGWLIGILLTLVADYLPRFAGDGSRARSTSLRLSKPALWQFIAALVNRKDAARLPNSLWQNLGTEVLTPVLFAGVWGRQVPIWNSLLLSFLCSFLILVALIDLRYRLVLNIMVLPAAALTILIRYAVPRTDMLAVLIGGAFGFAIFALAAFVRPGGLGGGDVKLATLIGLAFGFPDALWALMIGILAGGIIAILMLLNHRGHSKSEIPYAPFLCLGAMAALFYNPVPLILFPFIGH
jgi:prepilin signal peptidase PulO-like enzyme (type II secretory pathway)